MMISKKVDPEPNTARGPFPMHEGAQSAQGAQGAQGAAVEHLVGIPCCGPADVHGDELPPSAIDQLAAEDG